MKIKKLKEKKKKELTLMLLKIQNKYFNLRLQAKHKQLKQFHLLKLNRKKIARIKTILTEKKQNEKKIKKIKR